MCLAVPARIVDIVDQMAVVEIGGLRKQASLVLLPEASLGDYILLHAGFGISLVDETEALETMALFNQMTDSQPGEEDG